MTTPLLQDSALRQNILMGLGLDRLSAEEQEKALQALGTVIFQKVIIRVLELLPAERLSEFNRILESEEQVPGSLLSFLKKEIPNLDAVLSEEIAEFKRDSMEVMDAARMQAEM
ncbi:MAG: DUF5663 domain-containing protein [Patescibacteria group bacterium]